MSIITKTGDHGTTGLMFNRRVSKTDPRVEAYGAVDELTAALGMARAFTGDPAIQSQIRAIQQTLISVMGELATATADADRYAAEGYPQLQSSEAAKLESLAAEAEKHVGRLKGWAIPGDNVLAAGMDSARVACRKAERRVCALLEKNDLPNKEIVVFLNRLSDLLFLWARLAERGSPTVPPQPQGLSAPEN